MGDFLQFNPDKNNQLSDEDYAGSSYRENGAQVGIAPANAHNKLFYQVSTMVAAIAQAMVAKGYTISDADLATLATELGHIVTDADKLNIDMSSFTITSTGAQTKSSLSFAPKFMIILGRASQSGSLGFDNGTNRRCITIQMTSSSSGVYADASNSYSIYSSDFAANITGYASLTSDGYTLNSVRTGTSLLITVYCIAIG